MARTTVVTSPSPDSDQLLEDVVTGARRLDDAVIVARCDSDPAFAAALAELARVRGLLEDAGEVARVSVAEAQAERVEADAAFTRTVLSRAGRPGAGGTVSKTDAPTHQAQRTARLARLRLAAAAVAAAAVFALVVVWPKGTAPVDPVPRGLLSMDERIESPRGEVRAFETLVVDYDALRDFVEVRVSVHDFATDETLVARSGLGSNGTWTLDDTELAAMAKAKHVRVRVFARSRTGDEVEFSSEARLR